MSKSPPRYPLAWPAGRARTPWAKRIKGDFKMTEDGKEKRLTIEAAFNRVEVQVDRLGGIYPLLSSNLELRLDGRPRADRAPPQDPGVCLYFQLKEKPYAMACDTYDTVAQNIAALAAHIEAVRRIERYRVASAAETLQAFQALPPPPPGGSVIVGAAPAPPWHVVLEVARTASESAVQAVFRAKLKEAQGDDTATRRLIEARDAALRAIAVRGAE
jgi:hypothetical protein